ncbi:hypothetical protein L3Q67_03440 [Saccharothrix sp. AJ9571]|nr:hypothetical protein L3Q67_03440 [Saccharothrix sp. AJ9571]
MSAGLLAYGIVAVAALTWLLIRLVRSPRSAPLWCVTIAVACLAIAYPFGLIAGENEVFLGLPPMVSRLIQHGILLVAVNCLISFFLFSALDQREALRKTTRYLIPLGIAEVVLVVAAAITPAGVATNDHRVTGVALFFVTADAYMGLGFGLAARWAFRSAKGAERSVRRGLRMAGVGMSMIVVADCLFIPAVVLRWLGMAAAPGADGTAQTTIGSIGAMFFLLPGIVIFLIGFTYPAAARKLAAAGVWLHHRRMYHRLGPLWTVLHQEFPEDALSRVPAGRWRDLLSVTGVHRRYYRRVIECRDGLVRISPYLADVREQPVTHENLAGKLKEALRERSSGDPVPKQAVPVAMPEAEGLDADVRELAALSRALQASR